MKDLVDQVPGKKSPDDMPKPKLKDAKDAAVRVTKTTICATDLHILKGDVKTVAEGRILGREGIGIFEAHLMLLKTFAEKTVVETAAALKKAVEANNFGVMQIHNIKETMAKKGIEFDRECLIFEVCQPEQASKVLELDMTVSTALPCRISLYREGGKSVLAALKPTKLLAMFDTPQLQLVAQEIEEVMIKIMEQAAACSK